MTLLNQSIKISIKNLPDDEVIRSVDIWRCYLPWTLVSINSSAVLNCCSFLVSLLFHPLEENKDIPTILIVTYKVCIGSLKYSNIDSGHWNPKSLLFLWNNPMFFILKIFQSICLFNSGCRTFFCRNGATFFISILYKEIITLPHLWEICISL